MKASVDISYYPLTDEFIPPIKDLIARLKARPELEVRTNTMSTQVFGEYDELMNALRDELRESAALPHSVFVLKLVNADLR
ncbi:MAG TPA: hypothetical protein P5550_00795 [Bacteroidales bacterium]|nr:hypothetical protein [Bacteroidales bacterium]HRZ76080.1 hypothetical protein [Bacteroidales bacterium]